MRTTYINALLVAATFVFPGCSCGTTREVVKEPEPTPVVVTQPAPAPTPAPATTVINH